MKTLLRIGCSMTIASLVWTACSEEAFDTRPPGPQELSSEQSSSSMNYINSSKQDRKILFVSKQDGNDEIYAMNPDGSNVVRLTDNSVPDGRATWSANGQHIAFASGATGTRDIFVMNANGSDLRNITNTPEADEDWPDWSPKGNRIIFSSNRDGNHEIYVTDLDAEHTHRLTYRTEVDKWPAWSGDGSKIAFQSNAVGATTDVFVMDADGSNVARLTDNAGLDQMPTWSPDMQIAFMSNRNGKPQIFVMDQYGEGEVALNNLTGARPSWSRDGEWIVFTGGDGFPSTSAAYELYKMKNDGTNVTRITNNSWNDDYPFIK